MQKQESFFDFAAEVGLPKHIGGVEATETLVELCHIGEGKYVLDVGCGAGVTSCYLARRYGCRVVGVDILAVMVEISRKRAERGRIADRVEFRVADAQSLPFEDNLFDAVITESVTVFPADKQKAVCEYVRVTKPGGYIGLNETTWIKYPPPPEAIAWVSKDLGANIQPLTSNEWMGLLKKAGIREPVAKTLTINLEDESKGILRRYGCGGALDVFRRMLLLYFRNPAYRKFVKEIRQGGVVPANLTEYFGYGLYIGQK